MNDIASLGFAIDSAPLTAGSAALDQVSAAAARAEAAATRTVTAFDKAAPAASRMDQAAKKLEDTQTRAAAANDNAAQSMTRAERAANQLRDAQGRFVKAGNDAAAANDNIAVTGRRAEEATTRMNRAASDGEAVWGRLQAVLASVSAVLGVNAIRQMADTWSDINARVGLAIRDMDASGVVLDRLGQVARRTYSDLNLTAESFIRNATVLRELGKSTREQLDFTESLNLALVVSGARADRAAQVQDALGKAMAVGKLSGQELNTVIQTGGRVAEVLAEELGIGVNQLRQYGAQGKITGDVIFNALTKRMEGLREEAEKMPATIGDAFTLLRNAALQYIGVVDQSNKISEDFSKTLISLADNINILAGGAAAAGVLALALALRTAATAAVAFTAALAANPLGLVAIAISAVVGLLVTYKDTFIQIGNVTTTGAALMDAAWATLTGAVRAWLTYLTTAYEIARKFFTLDWSGIGDTITEGVSKIKTIAEETAEAWRRAMNVASSPGSFDESGFAIGPDLNKPGNRSNAMTDDQLKAIESYNKLIEASKQFIQMKDLEAKALLMTTGEAAKLRHQQEMINKAANDNITLTPVQLAQIEALAQKMSDAELRYKGAQLTMEMALLDPVRKLQDELRNLDEMLANNVISWETYEHAAVRANYNAMIAGQQAMQGELSARAAVANQAIELINTVGRENKAAAIAVIAISKGLAIAQAIQATAVASMRALADLGPIAGAPVAASINALGAAQVALIAATGIAQGAQALKGGGGLSAPRGGGGGAGGRYGSGGGGAGGGSGVKQGIHITLQGGDRFSREDVRELIETINDVQGDGGPRFTVS